DLDDVAVDPDVVDEPEGHDVECELGVPHPRQRLEDRLAPPFGVPVGGRHLDHRSAAAVGAGASAAAWRRSTPTGPIARFRVEGGPGSEMPPPPRATRAVEVDRIPAMARTKPEEAVPRVALAPPGWNRSPNSSGLPLGDVDTPRARRAL